MKIENLKALPSLSIPYAELKLSQDAEGNLKVFDWLRKKNVNLTPEEFVRQNFTHWLADSHGYPASLMANEISLRLNDTVKRCDTVVYSRELQPLVIVEYKAPTVEITQDTFDQIVKYNMELKARYLIVTNGVRSFCCKIDYQNNTYNFIRLIPTYEEAVGLPGVN